MRYMLCILDFWLGKKGPWRVILRVRCLTCMVGRGKPGAAKLWNIYELKHYICLLGRRHALRSTIDEGHSPYLECY